MYVRSFSHLMILRDFRTNLEEVFIYLYDMSLHARLSSTLLLLSFLLSCKGIQCTENLVPD
jgi:hypothetical protein